MPKLRLATALIVAGKLSGCATTPTLPSPLLERCLARTRDFDRYEASAHWGCSADGLRYQVGDTFPLAELVETGVIEITEKHLPTLVVIGAGWCVHCRRLNEDIFEMFSRQRNFYEWNTPDRSYRVNIVHLSVGEDEDKDSPQRQSKEQRRLEHALFKGGYGIPVLILLDSAGRVVTIGGSLRDTGSRSELHRDLTEALDRLYNNPNR